MILKVQSINICFRYTYFNGFGARKIPFTGGLQMLVMFVSLFNLLVTNHIIISMLPVTLVLLLVNSVFISLMTIPP